MVTALVSGLLSAISLPTAFFGSLLPDFGVFAWVALIPLYVGLRKATPKQALRRGFVFGCVHFSLTLYWLFIALHHYGEVPVWGSLLGVGVLVVIEAAFPAAVCWTAVRLSSGKAPRGVAFVLAWVCFEFLRNYFPFDGFSWAGLAYSQRSHLEILQILDVTGVYGVLFLLLLANVLGGEVWMWLRSRRKMRPPTAAAAVFTVALAVTFVYGHVRLPQVRAAAESASKIRVSMIQGNIPQDEKWIEEKADEIVARHLSLTEKVEEKSPDLVLWPEAAFPAVVPPDIVRIEELAKLKKNLLMGVVSYDGAIPDEWPPKPDDLSFALHNSAMLVEPGGFIADRYHKVHLVPLGEYLPMGKLLYSVAKIVPQILSTISSFTAGKEFNVMNLNVGAGSAPLQFGVTICYEDLFPEISRTFTRAGADFLVNVTNDGWYDRSSAIYQHFDFSRFRAIENRRAMIRATNTGKTGFFSPTGEVIAEAPPFSEASLTAEVPLMGLRSIYTRFGDFFAWGCVAGLGLIAVSKYYERH